MRITNYIWGKNISSIHTIIAVKRDENTYQIQLAYIIKITMLTYTLRCNTFFLFIPD